MNKKPIAWHEKCADSWRRSIEAKIMDVDRLQREIARGRDELAFYRAQIAEAKNRGLESFDRDRLLRRRKVPA